MGTDDPSHWKIHGDVDNFYYTAITDLKFVVTWAPTNKIIGNITDFTVLNVSLFQPWHITNKGKLEIQMLKISMTSLSL